MPIPDLETICVELTINPQTLSITFPGGASLDPELPELGVPDPMQLSKQLLAQANAALAPLGPVFNLIDIALALFNTVKAIPTRSRTSIRARSPARCPSSRPRPTGSPRSCRSSPCRA